MKLHHLVLAAVSAVALASCCGSDLNPPLPPGPYADAPPIPRRKFVAMHFTGAGATYGPSSSLYGPSVNPAGVNRPYGSDAVIMVLPPGARRVYYGGQLYFADQNFWYRSNGVGYVIVPAPY